MHVDASRVVFWARPEFRSQFSQLYYFIARNLGGYLAQIREIWVVATQISLQKKFGGDANETLAWANTSPFSRASRLPRARARPG